MQHLEEAFIHDVPLAVVDTETTGLLPSMGHRVVEIGAIRLEPDGWKRWKLAGQFSQLIQPGRSIDPQASQVNGIFDEDLIGAPPFDAIADELMTLLDSTLLVAHNAIFDAEFLGMELSIANMKRGGDLEYALPNPWLCTLNLARRHFSFGRNNLGHIARMLNVRVGVAHRALGDVFTTAEIFKRMVVELERYGIEKVGDFLHAQGGIIYAPVQTLMDLPWPLSKAVTSRLRVRILYLGPSGETTREINPRYATEYGGNQYLIAYCHMRGEQRTFRLDRILNAELLVDGDYSDEE
jgi:DNA polymerase III epsilon subunit family exonuclease